MIFYRQMNLPQICLFVIQSMNMRITPETRESQPCDAAAFDGVASRWDLSSPNLKRNGCCIPSFFAVQHSWAQDPMHMQHWGSAGQQPSSPIPGIINPRYLSSAPPGPGDAPGHLAANLSWTAKGQLGSTRGTGMSMPGPYPNCLALTYLDSRKPRSCGMDAGALLCPMHPLLVVLSKEELPISAPLPPSES